MTMVDYLKGVLEDLPEFITERIMSLVVNHMFQVSPKDEQMLLYEDRSTSFHHTLAQQLFVTSKARKHIKMSIYLLCTRVRISAEDDWGKPVRVIRYIRGTLYLPLILRANSLSVIKW